MIVRFLAQLVGTLLLPFVFFIIAKKNPGIIREIFYFIMFVFLVISLPIFIFDNELYTIYFFTNNIDTFYMISLLSAVSYIPIRIIFNKKQKKKASIEEPSI